MGVVKLSKSEITDYQKYSSMLAGNPAYSPPVFDLLETSILSNNAASVTFSGLGSYSEYKHLQIRAVYLNNSGGQAVTFLQLNSDTGGNYAIHRIIGNGSTVSTLGLAANTFNPSGIILNSSPPSGNPTAVEVVDILDFSSTVKNTTVRNFGGALDPSASNIVGLRSGLWINTSAVTSISITCDGPLFAIGSRFSLYGIK